LFFIGFWLNFYFFFFFFIFLKKKKNYKSEMALST
jgi:hypothetical protein